MHSSINGSQVHSRSPVVGHGSNFPISFQNFEVARKLRTKETDTVNCTVENTLSPGIKRKAALIFTDDKL
jgi:hypothetical protein